MCRDELQIPLWAQHKCAKTVIGINNNEIVLLHITQEDIQNKYKGK
jgi:hypothetical protein